MSKRFSTRVALIFAGWATALAVIFAVMFLGITQLAQQQLLADILAEDARRFIRADRHQEDAFIPSSSRSEVTDLEALSGGKLPEGFDPANPEPQEFVLDDGREIAAVSLDADGEGPGRILMLDTTEMNSVSARIDRHFGQIAITLVLVIILTAGISFLAAHHISRPIKRLSGIVEDSPEGAPTPGFSSTFAPDELGAVAGALDASLAATRDALERERTFNLGLSHELRSSLQAAEQALELSRPQLEGSAQLARLTRSLATMRQASEAVLWLSRPAEKAETFDPLDICEVMHDVTAALHGEARARHIEFDIQCETQPGPCLPRSVLGVILNNIARNAVRHSGGGVVQLIARQRQIMVCDDGSGFPENELERIQHGGALDGSGGSGLGLLLCRRLAERFGMSLTVDNHGTGARVQISF